jgi:hypothetical protein
MHVAVTLALEDEGKPYTMPNVAWMFRRVLPKEVRDILLLRRNYPDDYGRSRGSLIYTAA